MSLDDDVKDILQFEQEFRKEYRARVYALREKIIAGESTGDPIKDFVIATLHVFSTEYEKPYHDLKTALKIGEQVLVYRTMKYLRGFGIHPPPGTRKEEITIGKRFQYGIVSGPLGFDLKKGFALIPTEKQAFRIEGRDWEFYNEPIHIDAHDMMHFGKCAMADGDLRGLMVITGESAEEFLKKLGALPEIKN